MPDAATLMVRYNKLLDRVHVLRDVFGLSAAIYTQTTDVETECNGLLTYDRAISKLDPAVLRTVNHSDNAGTPWQVVVPNSRYGQVNWEYTTNDPGPRWQLPDFDDSAWNKGFGGFGTEGTPGDDIWLRREFTLGTEDLHQAQIQVHHDEDAEIYFNGVLAAQMSSFSEWYFETNIYDAAAATLKPGLNRMAVHCHQTTGGQFIDVGIVMPPVTTSSVPAK
jgi:hypothetical protein